MVLDKAPEPTKKVTLVVAKCDKEDGPEWEGKYVLITMFAGDPGKLEPFGRNLGDQECIKFWETHALVPTKEELAAMREVIK